MSGVGGTTSVKVDSSPVIPAPEPESRVSGPLVLSKMSPVEVWGVSLPIDGRRPASNTR